MGDKIIKTLNLFLIIQFSITKNTNKDEFATCIYKTIKCTKIKCEDKCTDRLGNQ